MLGMFLPVVRQSLREPREAASTLLSMGVPKQVLWPAFALLIVLPVILIFVTEPPTGPNGEVLVSPFALTLASAIVSVASVYLTWKIGVLMGGSGGFDETLLLTVFIQGIVFGGQLIEFAIVLIIPPFAGIYYVALVAFIFWLYLNFIAVLHGFNSLWRAFGVLLFASIAVAIVFIFVLSLAAIRIAGAA